MAEATAIILIKDRFENNEYNISTAHSMSFQEVANHLSEISGKEVAYISPDVATYKSTLVNAGELEAGHTDLPALLGREPVSYKQFLNGMVAVQNA